MTHFPRPTVTHLQEGGQGGGAAAAGPARGLARRRRLPPPVVRNFAGWLAATLMPRFRMEKAALGTCLERQDGDGMGYPEYL